MSTDRDRALAKIRKLLKLAKDGRGNTTEAETALRQAQALMQRFNVDEAEATAADLRNNPEAIAKAWCKAGYHARAILRTIPPWAGMVAMGVGALYECRVLVSRGGAVGAIGVVFGGYHTDVQVAVWTYEYLLDCIRRSGDNFEEAISKGDSVALQQMGLGIGSALHLLTMTSKARKLAFRQGMAAQLQHRMFAMVEQRKEKLRKATEQGVGHATQANALVVMKEQLINAAFGEQQRKDTKPPKDKDYGKTLATALGRAEGRKTNISPGPLEGGKESPRPLLS